MVLPRTGGIASNGSGDYVIAFSTHKQVRVPYNPQQMTQEMPLLHNDFMSPLFLAAIEATEEAIINSLLMAEAIPGTEIEELPVDQVLKIMKEYGKLKDQ